MKRFIDFAVIGFLVANAILFGFLLGRATQPQQEGLVKRVPALISRDEPTELSPIRRAPKIITRSRNDLGDEIELKAISDSEN